ESSSTATSSRRPPAADASVSAPSSSPRMRDQANSTIWRVWELTGMVSTLLPPEQHLRLVVAVRRDLLEPVQRRRQVHLDDLGALQGDHLPEPALGDQVDGAHAEAGREHAVEAGGGAAALDVAQHGAAGLDPGGVLDP